jgi:predicted nucleic acid-binding Zn ribbon protein
LSASSRRSGRRGPRQLTEAVARLRVAAMPPTLLAQVQHCWATTVGEQVAEEAEPTAERGGVVTVICRSSVWAAELTMLAPTLVEQLNETLAGPASLSGLRFVTSPS